jgi:uncharacterized RDD family membrane protein YckC
MADSPALPRRLAALLYDVILVLPIMMLSVFVVMAIRSLVTGAGAGELGTPALHPQIVQLIAWTAGAAFFCSFWLKGGQTLGMQAWRIRLVPVDGGRLTLRLALVRALAATFSAACFGLGYLWCLVDRDGRYWHDRLSHTRLELLPKKTRGRPGEIAD